MGSRAQSGIFLAPTVIEQTDACSQHLRAGEQQWIVEAFANLLSLLDGSDASVRIDEAEGPRQATECVYLSCFEINPSCQRRCALIRFARLRHAPLHAML